MIATNENFLKNQIAEVLDDVNDVELLDFILKLLIHEASQQCADSAALIG